MLHVSAYIGRTLTQDQKEGLTKFIESRRDLLSGYKDNTTTPLKPGARNESAKSLDLKKEPELTALMGASDIINEMLHRYLDEEGKAD